LAGDAKAAVKAYRHHLEHVRDTTIVSMTARERKKRGNTHV